VLQEESFLFFLWSQLEAQKLKGVVFLQAVAHLKMLDANEQYALQESRHGLMQILMYCLCLLWMWFSTCFLFGLYYVIMNLFY